jgi:phosphatidylserine decarboxylase
MKTVRVPVAAEGIPFIFSAAFITFISALLSYDIAAFFFLALTAFVLYFFRDPQRIIPDDHNALVSPADGKVILMEKIFDDRFIREHVYKISIFMNVFNVHVNRIPFSGRVNKIIYSPGKFYSADTDKAALTNEYCALLMETPRNQQIAVVQVAGLIARRIVCWAEKDDSVTLGHRYGLIRFGSRVDLYLPLNFRPEISLGQKVSAGETVIGYMPDSEEKNLKIEDRG